MSVSLLSVFDTMTPDTKTQRRKKTVSDFDALIAAAKIKRDAFVQKRAERIARLVIDSGLADLDIDDKALKTELVTLRERFQNSAA